MNLAGEMGEIGHGGAYPRAASEVSRVGGVVRARMASRGEGKRRRELACDAWR